MLEHINKTGAQEGKHKDHEFSAWLSHIIRFCLNNKNNINRLSLKHLCFYGMLFMTSFLKQWGKSKYYLFYLF